MRVEISLFSSGILGCCGVFLLVQFLFKFRSPFINVRTIFVKNKCVEKNGVPFLVYNVDVYSFFL